MKPILTTGANFSRCGLYRWSLWRTWDDDNRSRVAFVGLNPSTAGEVHDDPTVRRCIRFAQAWGYGGMLMLNIFALRSTDPKALYKAADPVGAENDHTIKRVASEVDLVVACWGCHGDHLGRGEEVAKMLQRAQCFGVTKGGHPRHPLYLANDTALVEFTA